MPQPVVKGSDEMAKVPLRVILGYTQKEFVRELDIKLQDPNIRQLLAGSVPAAEIDRIAASATRLRFSRTLKPEDQARAEELRRWITLALNQPAKQATIAS